MRSCAWESKSKELTEKGNFCKIVPRESDSCKSLKISQINPIYKLGLGCPIVNIMSTITFLGIKKKFIPMIAKIYILEMVPNYPQYLLLSKVKDNEVKEKC